ncbi:MAG TPA: AAA family ATPase [Polyangiaceae bacterium]|nr:AAA family ATPase [Polyangiaceae bacterium]
MNERQELVPLLVARGARAAIDFYVRALGAEVLALYEHGPERRVSHADLRVSTTSFAVTEEAPSWNSESPLLLGGSPVVLQLFVEDVDAVVAAMHAAGASVVLPVRELLGERMARLRDPFGHLWLLRQRVDELSTEELQRRRDELFARIHLAHPEDANTVGDDPMSRQGPADGPRGAIHLVIGPIGAGKSTFALGLARQHGAVRFTLDDWMTRLFSPDRPDSGLVEWYVERAARCIEQIWSLAMRVVDAGLPAIFEIGLLQRHERELFYERAAERDCALTVHVVDAARDVRRERVMKRNETKGETFAMIVPPALFELASDRWEPPDADECAGRAVRFVRTDGAAKS